LAEWWEAFVVLNFLFTRMFALKKNPYNSNFVF